MYQREKIYQMTFLGFFSGLMISCSSIPLEEQAQRVNIAVGSVPKGCIFRGDVAGVTSDAPIASHKGTEASQTNVLRDQAAKLGANVIFVTTHKTTYYPQFIAALGDWIPEIDTHTIDGKAYYCSSFALGKIKHKGVPHISETETVVKNW